MELRVSRSAVIRAGVLVSLAAAAAACGDDDRAATSADATASSTPTTASPESPSATTSATSTGSALPDVSPAVGEVLATDLVVPWHVTFLPDRDVVTALVSSRDTGEILLVRSGSTTTVGTLDVVSRVTEGGETGLLGLALHPSYPDTPLHYAYTTTATDNRVVRMTYDGKRLGTPTPVLTGIATSLHHNGGGLAFGPDGMLYVSTGDAEDTANAQDTGSLNGKILRVTDAGKVPSGNPFGNATWTYGHRNVEGITFDDSGRLWASEFGDHLYDELNLIEAGHNYGWPFVEGSDGKGGYTDPLAQWKNEDCSPSGVAIAAGRAWLGALQGHCLYSVVLDGDDAGTIEQWFAGDYGRLRAVSTAPDGSLWVGTSNRDGRATPGSDDDRILRVTLEGAADQM